MNPFVERKTKAQELLKALKSLDELYRSVTSMRLYIEDLIADLEKIEIEAQELKNEKNLN